MIETEILNYEQGLPTPERQQRPSGRKAAPAPKSLDVKVTAALRDTRPGEEAPARKRQSKYIIKVTFDARQISKTKAQTEVMLLLIPEGREGELYCQSAMLIRTCMIYTGKDSKELLQSNLDELLKEMADVQKRGLRYSAEKDMYLGQDPDSPLKEGDRNVAVEFVMPADMCAHFGLHGHGGGRDPHQQFCTHCYCRMDQRSTPFRLIRLAQETTVAGIAKQYSMTPELVWALNAGSDPIGHLPDAELTDTALHHKTMPLADTAAHAASRYLVPHRRGGAFKLMPLSPPHPSYLRSPLPPDTHTHMSSSPSTRFATTVAAAAAAVFSAAAGGRWPSDH